MMRLFSMLFLFTFSTLAWSQQPLFQGRVDMGRDLASFETQPPVKGTLYLLIGAAQSVRILSKEPFSAEVVFVQAVWEGEAELTAHKVVLRFEGDGWAKVVVSKKPRDGTASLVYPYRRFQAAAVFDGAVFRVVDIPALF